MKSIEQLLNSGQLSAVTIWISDGRVQCNTKSVGSDGWSVHYGETPGEALRKALEFNDTFISKTAPSFIAAPVSFI